MAAFALTIFTGAFLLFQVQPLLGKYILPWFGGGPGVWTTCMLFFQVLLLGGYAYAHLLSRWFRPRTQALIHIALLLAALALLPIVPSDSWKPTGGENPTLRILALLTVSLGLPYFVLSSTGPLMQQWFSQTHPGRSPYRLYALSNVGSLLALVSYPFFFETHFTRKTQAGLWAGGLVAFVVFCAYCAVKVSRGEDRGRKTDDGRQKTEDGGPPSSVLRPPSSVLSPPSSALSPQPSAAQHATRNTQHVPKLLWLLLPACASVLLLATTNKICQDVAVIPFLWVVPLSLYLLTFIIAFDSPRWYVRLPFTLALIGALVWMYWVLDNDDVLPIYTLLGAYGAGLFVACMVCHGELYRLRPGPEHLTLFYLMIASGGALGGVLVAVVAPLIFNGYYELPWGYFLCGALFWVTLWAEGRRQKEAGPTSKGRGTGPIALFYKWRLPAGLVGVVALGAGLWVKAREPKAELVSMTRNFYGVLKVYERAKGIPEVWHEAMLHGRVLHGIQLREPAKTAWPTTYYHEQGGGGRVLRTLLGPVVSSTDGQGTGPPVARPAPGRRIGLVGLGAGTMATYARTNDYFRFYELNPEVERLARTYFTFLSACRGTVEVITGDARLSLEREAPQQFDALVLDAFSGDAVPAHLLTKECFGVYERHLKTNGVIIAHITNKCLDLEPVLARLAAELGYQAVVMDTPPPGEPWNMPCTWMLLTRNEQVLNAPLIREVGRPPKDGAGRVRLWTDDFTSLFQILR